jgi:hypothetical protein
LLKSNGFINIHKYQQKGGLKMARLQELYWLSQSILDGLFTLENRIHMMLTKGKKPRKAMAQYDSLLADLHHVKDEMHLLETA